MEGLKGEKKFFEAVRCLPGWPVIIHTFCDGLTWSLLKVKDTVLSKIIYKYTTDKNGEGNHREINLPAFSNYIEQPW